MNKPSFVDADLNAAEIVIAVSELLQEQALADISRKRIDSLKTVCKTFFDSDTLPDFLHHLLLSTVSGLPEAQAVSNA